MKALFLTLSFCLISLFSIGQVSNNTTLVRVTETWVPSKPPGFTDYKAKIHISFPDGQTEEAELSTKGISDFTENTKKIHTALDKFFSDDYELVSQLSSGGDLINNYIWIFKAVKKETE
jgi:hypothetical protein